MRSFPGRLAAPALLLALALVPASDAQTGPRLRGAPAAGSPSASGGVVLDGSFEAGTPNPVWTEASTAFGTPLCDVGCTGSVPLSHQGQWWAWFGGTDEDVETGVLEQTITLPPGTDRLTFWLFIPVGATPGVFTVSLGGDELFRVTEADQASYFEYTFVSLDVGAYADGQPRALRFEGTTTPTTPGALTSFMLDVVDVGIATASEGAPAPLRAFRVAPNPSRGAPIATLELARPGPVTVEVLDALGRRVLLLHDGALAAGRHQFAAPAGRLAPGVYVARVREGEGVATRRFTVVR